MGRPVSALLELVAQVPISVKILSRPIVPKASEYSLIPRRASAQLLEKHRRTEVGFRARRCTCGIFDR